MNMTEIFSGLELNGTEYLALSSLNVVELLSHCLLDCPFSVVIFVIIWRTSILHPNLKFILLAQSCCIFLRGINRTILLAYRFAIGDVSTLGSPLMNFLIIQPTYVRNFIIHVLVIERIMATLRFRTYEKSANPCFSICWLLLGILLGFMNAYANSLDVASLINLSTYFVIIVLGILEILAFAWILRQNAINYSKKLAHAESLSERYQLTENIRTAKQLIPCICFHLFNICYGALTVFALDFGIFGDHRPFYYQLFCNHLLYTSTTFSCFGIELSMLIFHPRLRQDLFELFKNASSQLHYFFAYICQCQSNKTPVISLVGDQRKASSISTTAIMNVHGKQLVPEENDQLADVYFQQLNSSWQISPSSGKP